MYISFKPVINLSPEGNRTALFCTMISQVGMPRIIGNLDRAFNGTYNRPRACLLTLGIIIHVHYVTLDA